MAKVDQFISDLDPAPMTAGDVYAVPVEKAAATANYRVALSAFMAAALASSSGAALTQVLDTDDTAIVRVASIAALRAMPFGRAIDVDAYYDGEQGGGGSFVADFTDTTSADNGCTIIVNAIGWRLKRVNIGPVPTAACGISFNGLSSSATRNTLAWQNLIAQVNAGALTDIVAEAGTCYVNAYLGTITAKNAAIRATRASIMRVPDGVGNVSRLMQIGAAGNAADYFTFSGFRFVYDNYAAFDATSLPTIYMHSGNKCKIEDVDFSAAPGFIKFGSGLDGIVSNGDFLNITGLTAASIDNGSAFLLERVNGSLFDSCQANISALATPISTFSVWKVQPTNGEECDGNFFTNCILNTPTGPNIKTFYIDVTQGAWDNSRFHDCTFDLSIGIILHCFCDAVHHANSQITRMQFERCRFTGSTDLAATNPVIKIENTGDVPMTFLQLSNCNIGVGRVSPIVVTGTASTSQTFVEIIDCLFNDRANGAGGVRDLITTNGGIWYVRRNKLRPANSPSDTVSVGYLINPSASLPVFIIDDNKGFLFQKHIVNTANLPVNYANSNIIENNVSRLGASPCTTAASSSATPITLLQRSLLNGYVYRVSCKVVGIRNDGLQMASYTMWAIVIATSGTAAIKAQGKTVEYEDDASWDAVFDTSTSFIRVRPSGAASTTIAWAAFDFKTEALQ